MLFSDAPTVEDAVPASRSAAAPGSLTKRMLAAIGITPGQAYGA